MQPTLLSGIKSVPIIYSGVFKYQHNTILDKFIQGKLYLLQFTLTSENSGSYGAEFGRNKCGGRRQPLW